MDLKALRAEVSKKTKNQYKDPIAFGIARQEFGQTNKDKVISLDFAKVNYKENANSALVFMSAVLKNCEFNLTDEIIYPIDEDFIASSKNAFGEAYNQEGHKNIEVIKILESLQKQDLLEKNRFVFVAIFNDTLPKSIQSIYLKLYLLSTQKVLPRSLNLNGAFGILPNLAWSGKKAFELEWLRKNEMQLKLSGNYPNIDYVDKFPRFLMHILPANNTRILDTSKVRMGAYISDGTTIMPGAAYVNFNAGTLGASMVEGRISSSAIVGKGSDVGGGASILGVLSGTDGNPITIGENCLLGANSVTGIPLGNACIIDAGIAILEGTKITINQKEQEKLNKINKNFFESTNTINFKAKDLAGLHGMHFRQNSLTGEIMCLKSKREVKLNESLH